MAGAAIDEELGEFEANAASAPGDEVGGVGANVERRGLRDHNFAGVSGVGHMGEGRGGVFEGEGGDREGVDGSVGEEDGKFVEMRSDFFRVVLDDGG